MAGIVELLLSEWPRLLHADPLNLVVKAVTITDLSSSAHGARRTSPRHGGQL